MLVVTSKVFSIRDFVDNRWADAKQELLRVAPDFVNTVEAYASVHELGLWLPEGSELPAPTVRLHEQWQKLLESTFDVIHENFKQILDSAKVWVKNHPKGNSTDRRVWIKSVVLTRRVYQDFVKIEASASGQKSDVIGVSTGVYSKDENIIRSVIIGFESFDIDKLVESSTNAKQQELLTVDYVKIFDDSKFLEIIEGEIQF